MYLCHSSVGAAVQRHTPNSFQLPQPSAAPPFSTRIIGWTSKSFHFHSQQTKRLHYSIFYLPKKKKNGKKNLPPFPLHPSIHPSPSFCLLCPSSEARSDGPIWSIDLCHARLVYFQHLKPLTLNMTFKCWASWPPISRNLDWRWKIFEGWPTNR